ncbi:MAG: hypothetical protein PHE89_01385 [Alphaproteobacteria bacterium]|nr:hypothetical protein [Alphaproteobacteria bacterium]
MDVRKIANSVNNSAAVENSLSVKRILDFDNHALNYINLGGQDEKELKRLEEKAKSSIPFRDRFEKERQESLEKEEESKREKEWRNKNLRERFKEKFKLNNNEHEDILYKKNKDITAQEIKDTSRYTWFESKDKNLNQKLNNKISSWNEEVYGKESSVDATGRQVQPVAKTSIASERVEAKTKDGLSVGEGFDKISESMSSKNSDVSALQTGLNNSYDYSPALKVDGDLGVKTTSRTKEAMFDFGVSDVLSKLFG